MARTLGPAFGACPPEVVTSAESPELVLFNAAVPESASFPKFELTAAATNGAGAKSGAAAKFGGPAIDESPARIGAAARSGAPVGDSAAGSAEAAAPV